MDLKFYLIILNDPISTHKYLIQIEELIQKESAHSNLQNKISS